MPDSKFRKELTNHRSHRKLMENADDTDRNSYRLLRPFLVSNTERKSIEKMLQHRKNQQTLFVEYCAHAIACEHKTWLRMSKRLVASSDKVRCLNEAAKARQVLESLKDCIELLGEQ